MFSDCVERGPCSPFGSICYAAPLRLCEFGLSETKPNRSVAVRMRTTIPRREGVRRDRFDKVAASPNSHNLSGRGISELQ